MELIERLEKADGPDELLDYAIFRATGGTLPDEFAGRGIELEWQGDGTATMSLGDMQLRFTPPKVTSSIDAALALCERVLPGWKPSIGQNVHHEYWTGHVAHVVNGEIVSFYAQHNSSAPIAFLLTIFKALEAQS